MITAVFIRNGSQNKSKQVKRTRVVSIFVFFQRERVREREKGRKLKTISVRKNDFCQLKKDSLAWTSIFLKGAVVILSGATIKQVLHLDVREEPRCLRQPAASDNISHPWLSVLLPSSCSTFLLLLLPFLVEAGFSGGPSERFLRCDERHLPQFDNRARAGVRRHKRR